jgi:pimeloyl-ACP methyl ester carboxylesterase
VYICSVRTLLAFIVALLLACVAAAQKTVSFPTEDGGVVYADLYGEGDRAVVLAHGGPFNKESWAKQAQTLASAGFRVLAFDFRGYGKSQGPGQSDVFSAPLHLDVLASVRYLRKSGAKTVAVVGGSMGGGAAGDASIASQPGEIDRVVFLGAYPNGPSEKLKCPSLFIVARDDASEDGPRLPKIREKYESAPEPKQLIILEGSAHAQYLFQTDQAERVMREILRFLSAKPDGLRVSSGGTVRSLSFTSLSSFASFTSQRITLLQRFARACRAQTSAPTPPAL